MYAELIRILDAVQELSDALSMTHGTILVAHEESAETSNFIMQLADLLVEGLILSGVHLDLGLEVGEPLLLPLTTFEGGHTESY